MNDSGLVRPVERRRDLRRQTHRLVEWQRSSRQSVGQRLTLEQLHHEIPDGDRLLIVARRLVAGHCRLADVVKDADMGMVQRGDRARLTIETLARLRVVGDVRRQHLDGDRSAEARVARAVHLAHPAGTNPSAELVRTDLRTFQIRGDCEVCE